MDYLLSALIQPFCWLYKPTPKSAVDFNKIGCYGNPDREIIKKDVEAMEQKCRDSVLGGQLIHFIKMYDAYDNFGIVKQIEEKSNNNCMQMVKEYNYVFLVIDCGKLYGVKKSEDSPSN